jgi:hypothetical protein
MRKKKYGKDTDYYAGYYVEENVLRMSFEMD